MDWQESSNQEGLLNSGFEVLGGNDEESGFGSTPGRVNTLFNNRLLNDAPPLTESHEESAQFYKESTNIQLAVVDAYNVKLDLEGKPSVPRDTTMAHIIYICIVFLCIAFFTLGNSLDFDDSETFCGTVTWAVFEGEWLSWCFLGLVLHVPITVTFIILTFLYMVISKPYKEYDIEIPVHPCERCRKSGSTSIFICEENACKCKMCDRCSKIHRVEIESDGDKDHLKKIKPYNHQPILRSAKIKSTYKYKMLISSLLMVANITHFVGDISKWFDVAPPGVAVLVDGLQILSFALFMYVVKVNYKCGEGHPYFVRLYVAVQLIANIMLIGAIGGTGAAHTSNLVIIAFESVMMALLAFLMYSAWQDPSYEDVNSNIYIYI